MVRRNDQRRATLVDAAIEVLAREGARGLTFRAVDAEAAVPAGTACSPRRAPGSTSGSSPTTR